MADKLKGKRFAFLVAPEGTEQVELTEPWKAVEEEGHARAGLDGVGEIQAFNHLDKGDTFPVDRTVGRRRCVRLRRARAARWRREPRLPADGRPDAVRFVRDFFEQAKPVGVICHGPWTLVEADVVRGRTITSWPSVKTDLRNAGANWVDEEVVVDEGLVSSRKPDDLPAFCAKLVEEFCEGEHEQQARSVGAGTTS